jgi:hypothetical protein
MPTGGVFDDAGNLWLLEASLSNKVRVQKINHDKPAKGNNIKKLSYNNIIPRVAVAASVITFLLSVIYFEKKYIKNSKAGA